MKALVVVDIQNDFTPGGALAVPGGDEIIPLVNELQRKFDLTVATQDWHPQQHKSFASTHTGLKPFDKIILNGLEQVLWPDHCVQEFGGAQFHPHLRMNRVEAIFRKGMDPEIDSYSAFYDNGHKKSTGLAGYLRERKVDEVYLCGLAGDYCVYYTAKDALDEKFNVYVIEDAVRSLNEKDFEDAKQDMLKRGGKFTTTAALLNL